MKKKKHHIKTGQQSASNDETESSPLAVQSGSGVNDDGDANQGFSDWLQSDDGIGYMRMFVVANSLVLFLTMTWPQVNVFWDIFVSAFSKE